MSLIKPLQESNNWIELFSCLSIDHVSRTMQKNRDWTIILLAINLYLGVISHHYLFLE